MRLNSLVLSLTVVGAMAMPLLYAAPAQAQRTWVSGVGDDVNPCSRTAPCKTWAGAISKTGAGQEINALDPGGYGAVTITKSITIDGGGGQVASTLVANTNGMVVAAGATDIVVIRNVRFQGGFGNGGAVNPGLSGIVFQSGKALVVDNCDIMGFSVNGVSVTGNGLVAINNTRIEDVGNSGIGVTATSATVKVDNVRVYVMKFGVAVASGNKVSVNGSSFAGGTTAGVEADPGGVLFVNNSEMSFNATGVSVGAGATVVLANNDITFNATGTSGGGTAQSFSNNRFSGNTGTVNAITPIGTNPSGQQ